MRHEIEVGLLVEDFFSEERAERIGYSEAKAEAFDACAEKGGWHARRMIRPYLHRSVRITEAKISEFDSGNLSHANGYIAMTLEGPEKHIRAFVLEYFGEEIE